MGGRQAFAGPLITAARLPPQEIGVAQRPSPAVTGFAGRLRVWDYGFCGDGGVVEPCISYLRRKADQGEPRLIHTIRGVGYMLRVPPP